MTTPGRYASSDNSFAGSAGNAAARGVMLIVVAVLIGVVLLAKGFDGPSVTSAGPVVTTTTAPSVTTAPVDSTESTTSLDNSQSTETSAPVAAPAPSLRPPAEVKVVVANGSGVKGAAGAAKGELTAAGYVAEAKNATTSNIELSAVYYIDGYKEEAKVVAQTLGGTESLLRAAPADPLALIKSPEGLEDFHIFVILGLDKAIG